MRVRLWMKGFAIVAGICLAGLPATAQQQGSSQQQTGDPVADAARKAREAKKDAPKPKKVYTDDDVKRSAPEPAATAPATPGTPAGATGAENNRAEINEKLAKLEGKRKELGELQQGLADLEDQLRKSGGNPGWAR